MLHARVCSLDKNRPSLCDSEGDLSLLQPCSMPSADMAAICPCISIIPHDKLRLIKKCLPLREKPHSGKGECVYNKNIYRLDFGPPDALRHDCYFLEHPWGTITIRTEIFLEGNLPSLHVVNQYAFWILHEVVSGSEDHLPRPHEDAEALHWKLLCRAMSSNSSFTNCQDKCECCYLIYSYVDLNGVVTEKKESTLLETRN